MEKVTIELTLPQLYRFSQLADKEIKAALDDGNNVSTFGFWFGL